MGSERPSSNIHHLVEEVKHHLFSQPELSGAISDSAYDTAWVAMVPEHGNCAAKPMFPSCLAWILENQRQEGFWGETMLVETLEVPAIDCLTSTLACIVACKVWHVGQHHIKRGLGFLRANTEKMLKEYEGELPWWFHVVLPGMLEAAASRGVHVFPEGVGNDMLTKIYQERRRILQMKEMSQHDLCHRLPLLSYLEVLPETCDLVDKKVIVQRKSEDGSLFRSPSATAAAFMVTGDEGFLPYLRDAVGSKAQEHGVVGIHPIDDVTMNMCLVDFLQSIGCSEHFEKEIDSILKLVYSDFTKEEKNHQRRHNLGLQLYKDSLAFRLLRVHGYNVSPDKFCWFVHNIEVMKSMEENPDYFQSVMHSIHKASDLVFMGESDLDMARAFSEKLFLKAKHRTNWRDGVTIHVEFLKQYEHELGHPWITTMNHLEHRRALTNISNILNALWSAKASFFKLSYLNNTKLVRLAKENFTLRQSIFREELEQLKRWSKEEGLSTIGFGREKTAYCYFSVSSNSFSPHLSEVRKMATKCTVLVTVADDYFDSEGTLKELIHLTKAVHRWECEGLSGSSKIIFKALYALVEDISKKCYERTRHDVKDIMKKIWREAFDAWLQEAKWSRMGYVPSKEEYLHVGVKSIGLNVVVLPACYLQCPQPQDYITYDEITLLTMYSGRILNDTQSFQKEKEEGKLNMVTMYLEENPNSSVNDFLPSMYEMIEMMKRKALKLILLNNAKGGHFPQAWKDTHLTILKAVHMLYRSANLFDSPTALLGDIRDALYNPLS